MPEAATPQVVVDAHPRTELQLRQRRIREPADLREVSDRRDIDQDGGKRRHPENSASVTGTRHRVRQFAAARQMFIKPIMKRHRHEKA